MFESDWDQALSNGKITLQDLGSMAHNGKGSYYDIHYTLEEGQDTCAATVQAVSQDIQRLAPAQEGSYARD